MGAGAVPPPELSSPQIGELAKGAPDFNAVLVHSQAVHVLRHLAALHGRRSHSMRRASDSIPHFIAGFPCRLSLSISPGSGYLVLLPASPLAQHAQCSWAACMNAADATCWDSALSFVQAQRQVGRRPLSCFSVTNQKPPITNLLDTTSGCLGSSPAR